MSNNVNPFLPTRLFRDSDDEKRIAEAKEKERNRAVNISFNMKHGWFSQSQANETNSYEEWKNLDGEIVSVTEVIEANVSNKPIPDARYRGIVAEKVRTVNLDGNELTERNVVVVCGTNRTKVPDSGATTVKDFISRSLLTLPTERSLRIEQNGNTIYEGAYTSGLETRLDKTSSYTIIVRAEAPRPIAEAKPSIPDTTFKIVVDGSPVFVQRNATLNALHTPRPESYTYYFNGMEIQDIKAFRFTSEGEISFKKKSAVPAMPAPPYPSSTMNYVTQKLNTAVNSTDEFPKKGPSGLKCGTQAELDNDIRAFFRDNRTKNVRWTRGPVASSDSDFHKRARARWPVGTEVVAMTENTTAIPVCTVADWSRLIGTDLPGW